MKDQKEKNVNQDTIEGRNPVMEALKSERPINKLIVTKGKTEGPLNRIIAEAKKRQIPVQFVDRKKIDVMSTSDNHQGVIAYVAAYEYADLDQVLASVAAKGEKPYFIICDGISDPHNLGSILRTADATGAHGVIIPKRRAVGLTSIVAKTSAGAIEYVPVCRVSNLVRAIETLKENGAWIVGADMDGDRLHFEADMKGGIGIVVGAEGEGISRLVKEHCDFLVQIPMKGGVSSLNASVAASILMYEVVRQNHQ